jgi:hypothetical protein
MAMPDTKCPLYRLAPLVIVATHHVSMRPDFLIAERLGGPPLGDYPDAVGGLPEVTNPQEITGIRLTNDVNRGTATTSV